jgi:hypothetical protein
MSTEEDRKESLRFMITSTQHEYDQTIKDAFGSNPAE